MEKQEYARAIVRLDRARSSDQQIPGIAFDWAMVHYRLADYTTSARLFDSVFQAEPGNVLARYYAGISYYRQQEYRTALDRLGAGYTYTDNDSNIANYEYRSHAFKFFVSARI